ncbi:MAG TPA: signal peptidase I [Candidatus Saccharimonadales bacterium]|jgi:signal peptidase I|nr:signal peptidase I [Candidatus Saccharimonadales bacterium]
MEATFLQRHPLFKDAMNILIFIVCVLIGTLLINTYVFRSFNVLGPSMETTLFTGDRLIVNRLPVTWSQLQNKPYVPDRGQVIVFKNPMYNVGTGDEFIVKRVIAFPGERVTVKEGVLTVYNSEHPNGFHPDDNNHGEPGSPTSGNVDTTVTEGTLFVAGDHRQGDYSYDSRSGLGLIPYYDVIGPVGYRIYPFTKMRPF